MIRSKDFNASMLVRDALINGMSEITKVFWEKKPTSTLEANIGRETHAFDAAAPRPTVGQLIDLSLFEPSSHTGD